MKYLLLTFLFIFLGYQCNGQLGLTEAQIRNKYPEASFPNMNQGSGDPSLWMITDEYIFCYYFNYRGLCDTYFMSPKSDIALKVAVDYLNKNYVIISENHWKLYKKDKIIDAQLLYGETGPTLQFHNLQE
jgi:hypothetical protein